MRVGLSLKYMTFEEADKAECFLQGLPYVYDAKVNERTSSATVWYDDSNRDELINELSHLDLETVEVFVPDSSARQIRHTYEDKMFFHIARRIVSRLVIPMSVREVVTVVKSVPYIIEGLKSLSKGKLEVSVLDATSIVVSIARGDFNTAGSVMFLLGVGDIMDEWTRKKSVDDLARAMSLNIDKVWVVTGETSDKNSEVLIDINKIEENDVIVVRTGNMIPLDGSVVKGDASVNQATITGEGIPVHKTEGSYAYAGTVVEEGELYIAVKKTAGEGQYDKIARIIEESEKLKSETESRAFKMADKLVPYTFAATALTYILTRNATRAISILMVDFCCALKLSMPIAVLSAMREAGQNYIDVKGGKFLEKVAKADTIIFDKTGTLTYACPSVRDVVAFDGEDPDEMLKIAACLEEHYPHSMANAVVKAAADKGIEHEEMHAKVEYVVAHGIASSIDGVKVVIGSHHFVFEDEGCSMPNNKARFDSMPEEYSRLYLAIGGVLKAVILVEDSLKEEAKDAVSGLQELGLKVVMLTGDSTNVAAKVAEELGVDEFRAQMLPEDKAAYITAEQEAGRKCIMIGDGVNDSPALSAAEVGVAINSGAAIAREVADIMISQDDLEALIILRKLGTALQKRTESNYRTIIGFNAGLILLGALGILQPTTTALLHNGSTIAIGIKSTTNLLES